MVEMRIRTRHALTMAAYGAKYVPASPNNLYYLEASTGEAVEKEGALSLETLFGVFTGATRLFPGSKAPPSMVTYEVFRLIQEDAEFDGSATPPGKPKLLVIAWMPSGYVQTAPLAKLQKWVKEAALRIPECHNLVSHLVLGPPSSDMLTSITENYLKGGGSGGLEDQDHTKTFLLSPWATMRASTPPPRRSNPRRICTHRSAITRRTTSSEGSGISRSELVSCLRNGRWTPSWSREPTSTTS